MSVEITGQRWKVLDYSAVMAAVPQDGEMYVLSGVPNFEAPRVAVIGDSSSTVAQLVAMRQTRPIYDYDDVDTDIPEAGTQIALTNAPDTTQYVIIVTGDGTHTIAELVANYVANIEGIVVAEIGEIASSGVMALPGDIKMIAHASPDIGWLLCDGQAVSRTTYSALFVKIGETWGVGDGSTTFNVPDMREAAPVGVGTFSAVTGTTRGSEATADVYALAEFKDDNFQGHLMEIGVGSGGTPYISPTTAAFTSSDTITTGGPTDDGTNGTPRTGPVTRGKRMGLNFVIKY